MSRDHGCQHYCANTAGSFLCVCKDGFALAEDGTTCTCKYQFFSVDVSTAVLFSCYCVSSFTFRHSALQVGDL